MTEQEEIDICLSCEKENCDNCMSRSDPETNVKRNRLYFVNNKEYTIEELAQMRGISTRQMYYRIEKYGLDFAISNYSTYKTYLKETEKNEKA